jgi:hypothetical protein
MFTVTHVTPDGGLGVDAVRGQRREDGGTDKTEAGPSLIKGRGCYLYIEIVQLRSAPLAFGRLYAGRRALWRIETRFASRTVLPVAVDRASSGSFQRHFDSSPSRSIQSD